MIHFRKNSGKIKIATLFVGLLAVTLGVIAAYTNLFSPPAPEIPVAEAATVTIGTATLTSYFPLDVYFQYPCDISLYTASEIGTSGNITAVRWYRGTANSDAIDSLYVYIKHTSLANLNSTTIDTCNEATSGATLVYSNASQPDLDGTTTGWYPTITLGTAFSYNGADNLVVVVKTVTVPYETSYSVYRYTSSANNHRYCENDTSGACNTGATTLDPGRPNIQLEITLPNTAPTVTTPTSSAVTSSSATLGANVTSDGGAALTARGTCWGTTASPTTNCLAEGGTTTGVFTHSRTGLPASTLIYYRGYATNGVGTGYSADGTFTTLAAVTIPTVTSPTATSITSTSATLGANVTSDGGAALTARGTCWGTTVNPITNCLAATGTSTGVFVQARTSLTAGTLIYYRGYATNSVGTSYSPDGSFYTEPSTQASAVTFSSITSTTMTVNWTRGNGDGVIVLMKSGSAVNSDPVDGTYTGYTANAAFGSGTQLGTGNYVIYKGTGTNVAVTGLAVGTTYYVAVYEFKGTVDTSGTNQGTNYRLTPATGSQATTAAVLAVTSVTGQNPQSTSGGYAITINGSNFVATPTVTIGGTAATAVTFVSSTQLTATAPAKAAGSYNVVVTNPDTQSGTCTNCMTYIAPPTITGVNPNNNLNTAGGQTVTIDGSGLKVGSNGAKVDTTYVTTAGTASQVTFTTPAHAAGSVTLRVYGPSGTDSNGIYTNYSPFTYFNIPVPTVTTIAASNVTSVSATFNGSANPNGYATNGWFRWGLSNVACSSLPNVTSLQPLGSGAAAVNYNQAISGLSPSTPYYFCAAASNSGGTSYGNVLSFTTPAAPISFGATFDVGTNEFKNYAWSENIGWIGFNCATDPAGCSSPAGKWCVGLEGSLCETAPPPPSYNLTVNNNPSAGGTITASGGSGPDTTINCGADCTGTYNSGSNVTLTASAAGGYTFSSWAAGCASNPIPTQCVMSMSASKSMTANFAVAVVVPTVTTPTSSAITSSSATLGANVTSDGGAALTARGTCWGTTVNPITNCLAEGGITTGVFTQARTSLTAGTLIYYRGYATNSVGTSYSPDGSFYTEPSTQASAVTFSSITSTTMTVNWTRGNGDGVIVLMKSGSAVNSDPVDGTYTGYTANAAFGSGTQLGTGNYAIYKGTGTSVAVTGLAAGTTYYVAVYEFKGTVDTSGTNQGTNYRLTPATGSQATTAADGDGDGYAPGACGTGLDCCDSDNMVYPGQTAYFASANNCGNYDYNCDCSATRLYPSNGTCVTTSGWDGSIPACGVQGTWAVAVGFFPCYSFQTQSCR